MGTASDEETIRGLYQELLDGWNARDGEAFAAPFAADGEVIGFDGSEHSGRDGIASDLARIFADHPTGTYVAKIRSVRLLDPRVGVLRAISAIVPPGTSKTEPATNAHQTLVAAKEDDSWRIVLFQNTPAQFHGRPELVEAMTRELEQSRHIEGS